MLKKSSYVFTILIVNFLLTAPAQAEVDWVALVWQNDLLVGTDGGGYTNGEFISLFDVSTEGKSDYEEPFLTKSLSWMLNDRAAAFSERSLGQIMMTPKNIEKKIPDINDVPYAGLLFYRTSQVVVGEDRADMVSITLGIVGPSSYAEQTQKFVHKVVDAPKPQGWDYQIKDQGVFELGRSSLWRNSLSSNSDLLWLGDIQAGNLESSISGSAIIRYGKGLEKSFATSFMSYGRTLSPIAVDGGWNVYAGIETGYVFNHIFIDGDTDRKAQSPELRSNQFSVIGGISYAWQNVSLALSFQSTSPLDKADGSRDKFGALALAFRI